MRLGFALIEILVVIAVLALIVGIATVSYQSSFGELELNGTVESIVSDLRRAQSQALAGIGDSDRTINFINKLVGDDEYVIVGPPDITVTLPRGVRFSQPASGQMLEVSFARGSARLSAVFADGENPEKVIVITRAGRSKRITISETGRISSGDLAPE